MVGKERQTIANFAFRKPPSKEHISSQMTLRGIEVARACFDADVERMGEGEYSLREEHRVQIKLVVHDGKGDISTVNPNSVPNVEEMYGPTPHTKLDQPGQTYVYDMRDGRVYGMVACVRAEYQP